MIDEKHEEYRKIVLRFLKESGLYPAFIEYIKSKENLSYYKPISTKNWFEETTIDRILGKTRFTDFIERKTDCIFKWRITSILRTYVNKKYKGKYGFRRNLFASGEDLIIDEETDNIVIKAYEKKH